MMTRVLSATVEPSVCPLTLLAPDWLAHGGVGDVTRLRLRPLPPNAAWVTQLLPVAAPISV